MDTSIALFVHQQIPYTMAYKWFFWLFSWFGGSTVILSIIFISALYFTLRGRFNKAHIVILTGVTAMLTSSILKQIIARPRPSLWEPLDHVSSFSFPSGHALVTAAVFGVLAMFLAERFTERKRLIYIATDVLLFFIGLSRIYLGVHWPSDIIGGWLIGGVILFLMVLLYHHGGIKRTLRIALGVIFFVLGIIGLVIPVIPGILLLIAAFLLIFSNKSLADLLKKKGAPIPPSR